MRTRRIRPVFRDARGEITDLLDGVLLNAVTLITSRKGSVRGNHFHKKTVQHVYVLSGRLRYISRGKSGRSRSATLRPGDLATSPPGEAHAVVALSDSAFLTFSLGPRHGRDYERDTFRCAVPLTKPR